MDPEDDTIGGIGPIRSRSSRISTRGNKYPKPVKKRILERFLISPSSYIIINTLDGQIQINNNALFYLKSWSQRINMLPLLTVDTSIPPPETIPTLNVSNSYLTRLICIAIASYECYQFSDDTHAQELVQNKIRQILRMFDHHNRDVMTSFYSEEMDMIIEENEPQELELVKFMKSIGFTKPIEFSDKYTLPRIVTSSYILLNASDGQIKIPDDALFYLRIWSLRINRLPLLTVDTIPALNVSKSYLMRLICIARASYQCYQFSTIQQFENLVQKKKEQILRMFDVHDSDVMTSFYDDEMEINKAEIENFMQSIGREKPIDYSGKWILPHSFLEKVRIQTGIEIDTMAENFTIPQYTVIVILSYFEYLKNTHPEKVQDLEVKVSLLENPTNYKQGTDTHTPGDYRNAPTTTWTPITTWIPEKNIEIGKISIDLYRLNIVDKGIRYINAGIRIGELLEVYKHKITSTEKSFLTDIYTMFWKCLNNPANRNWSILKGGLIMCD